MKTDEILGRIGLAKQIRQNHERAVQEISDLCMPFRGDITTKKSPGQERIIPTQGVFDSTGILAQDSFVNFLKSAIFPSTIPWFKGSVATRHKSHQNSKDADAITLRMLRQGFAVSNFYNVVDSWLRDTAVLGTGTLYVEDKPAVARRPDGSTFGGLHFCAVPWSRVWFMTGKNGEVIFLVHEEDIPVIAAKRAWGTAGEEGNKKLQENPMELQRYMHIVWFNENGIPGGLRHPMDKPYVSHWCAEGGKNGLDILETKGSDLSQYITARWMVVDGEDYGRGQGHLARPDLKGVNKLKELVLDAAGVDLKPPFLVEDETAIDLDLGPSGLVVVRPGFKTDPKFLRTGSDYKIANDIGTEDRGNVKKAFLMDLIGTPETQERSAEATRDRLIKAAQRLAPRADKVHDEMMVPLVELVAERMDDHDALPELENLRNQGLEEMNFDFVSLLFTAQKRAPAERVDGWLEKIKRHAVELDRPDMLDRVNLDGYVDQTADFDDIPASMLNDDRTVEQIRARRQAEIERQVALDQAEQASNIQGAEVGTV